MIQFAPKNLITTVAMAALAALSLQPATASVAYLITVDTSSVTLTPPPGSVDFQFNPGPASQPATAKVSNFTGGTLGAPPVANAPAACFATATTTCGNVTGTLPTVMFGNGNSLNEYLQIFSFGPPFGPSFSFQLVLGGPAVDSPDGIATSGTNFCLALFSDPNGTVPIGNMDANGCNLTISINLDGTTTVAFASAITGANTVAVTALRTALPTSDTFQVGYAANLNIGDSFVNLTNAGIQGGVFGAGSTGNMCINVYVYDPQEEQVGCCACLVTPNGINSLSVKQDLVSNLLTPAAPTSITINLVASQPGTDKSGAFTVCNPATVIGTPAALPFNPAGTGSLVTGMKAWGTTLEPSASAGTYSAVPVNFINSSLNPTELNALSTECNFIQANGTGYGICKSCRLGALGGSKQ